MWYRSNDSNQTKFALESPIHTFQLDFFLLFRMIWQVFVKMRNHVLCNRYVDYCISFLLRIECLIIRYLRGCRNKNRILYDCGGEIFLVIYNRNGWHILTFHEPRVTYKTESFSFEGYHSICHKIVHVPFHSVPFDSVLNASLQM